jgi:hypothetical protein
MTIQNGGITFAKIWALAFFFLRFASWTFDDGFTTGAHNFNITATESISLALWPLTKLSLKRSVNCHADYPLPSRHDGGVRPAR